MIFIPCNNFRASASNVPAATEISTKASCAALLAWVTPMLASLNNRPCTSSALPSTHTVTLIIELVNRGSSTARLISPCWMIGRTLRMAFIEPNSKSSILRRIRSRASAIDALALCCNSRRWALCKA
ncbi:hypothetical protein D3C77_529080 [compost metagenome]